MPPFFGDLVTFRGTFFFHILDRRGSTALCGCAGEYSYRRWRYVHGEAWTKQQRCFVVFLELVRVQPKSEATKNALCASQDPDFSTQIGAIRLAPIGADFTTTKPKARCSFTKP